MERDYIEIAVAFELRACLLGRQAYGAEIMMLGKLNYLQTSRNVQLAPPLHLGHKGMTQVCSSKNLCRCLVNVPWITLFDGHYGEQIISGIT